MHPKTIPLLRISTVYHNGEINTELKETIANDSQEGKCLSVSLCPNAWHEIAKLGRSPLYRLHKKGGLFLDARRTQNNKHLFQYILQWAIAESLCQEVNAWKAWFFDDEIDEWRNFLCKTEEEATQEALSAQNLDEDEAAKLIGPNRKPAVEPTKIRRGTDALMNLSGMPDSLQDHPDDFITIAWAEYVANNYLRHTIDGIWWNEAYSPETLSAPRAGIFPSHLEQWHRELSSLHAVDDEENLATMPTSRNVRINFYR